MEKITPITAKDLRRAAEILRKRKNRRICSICGKYKNHSHYVEVENVKVGEDLLSI
jgi:hypothetical protein